MSQRLYDNFIVKRPATLSGVTWQQHDATNMIYRSTMVRLFDGAPENSTLLLSTNVVASRTRNQTCSIIGDTFDGYDYAIADLSVSLLPGTYTIGFSTIYDADGVTPGSGWDNTLGSVQTLPRAVLINSNFPPPGQAMNDFSFRILGVPVNASAP